jgi:hypothetical protein
MLQRAEQPLWFLHAPVLPPRARPTLALCKVMPCTRQGFAAPNRQGFELARVSPCSPQPLTRDPLLPFYVHLGIPLWDSARIRSAFISPEGAIFRGSGVSVNPGCMVAGVVLMFFVGNGECVMVHKKHNTLMDYVKIC